MQRHRQQPTRLPRPWDSPGKNTGVGCRFLLRCMKVKVEVKSLSRVQLLETLWTAAYQAPPSMGFSRQEYWSGVPLPSPVVSYTSLWAISKPKNDTVKVLHSICQHIWKLSSGHRTGKGPFSSQSLRKAMSKNIQTTAKLHSSHTGTKEYSKYSKPGFNSTWTVNFQRFKLDLEMTGNQRSNCQHPLDHQKSKRVPEKHLPLL